MKLQVVGLQRVRLGFVNVFTIWGYCHISQCLVSSCGGIYCCNNIMLSNI